MRKGQIMNVTYLKDARRQLRNNLTPSEAALWNLIKNKQLDGRKFRRQVGIGNYIVDFYCAEDKLVIELDGGIHNHPTVAENDKQRDERLKDLGYTVLRFNNQDLLQAADFVTDEIRRHFEAKQQ